MSKRLRRRHFVDREVQGRLVKMVVDCWALSLVTAGGLTVLGWIFITPGIKGFVGPESFMSTILPMVLVGLVASLLVLPVMLWNMVRVTHRFAGPLVRFKRTLREAAEGGPLVPIQFRDGDNWHELAESYNLLIARFKEQESEAGQVIPFGYATNPQHGLEGEFAECEETETAGI